MKKTCVGCKKKFWVSGGRIRVPSEDGEGYVDFKICRECASAMETMHPHGAGRDPEDKPV